jgi:hypothetical protein
MVGRARSEKFLLGFAAPVAQWWSHVRGYPPSFTRGECSSLADDVVESGTRIGKDGSDDEEKKPSRYN